MQKNNQTRLLEVFAAAITGIGKIVFINLIDFRLPFIILTCLGWLGYAIYRASREDKILEYWGLPWKGFSTSFWQLLPIVIVVMLLFLGFGYYFQTSVLDGSIVLILLLYPIWGVLQQFLVLGIFARNLADGWRGKLPTLLVIGLTALLFSIIHYPSPVLIGATFFLAIVYVTLYLRGHNIIVLGIYHGWLAAFFFYSVLGRNPWLEAFG